MSWVNFSNFANPGQKSFYPSKKTNVLEILFEKLVCDLLAKQKFTSFYISG